MFASASDRELAVPRHSVTSRLTGQTILALAGHDHAAILKDMNDSDASGTMTPIQFARSNTGGSRLRPDVQGLLQDPA
jgi:hypothetical protein